MQFGSSRFTGRRWVYTALLTCLVLAAVAVAMRGTGHQARRAAKPLPLPPPPAVDVTVVGHRLLGVTADWELFARGQDDLLRIQFAQGRITLTYVPPLESGNPDVSFVIGAHEAVIRSTDVVPGYVVPDGGQARQLTGLLAGGGPFIPGPALKKARQAAQNVQTAWVSSGSPTAPAFSLVALSGRRAGSAISFPAGGPPLPATAVPDGRGYVLVDTGSFSVYDAGPSWDRRVPGMVVAVGPANWLVVTCNPPYRRCRNQVIDTADGARRVLPGRAAAYPYDFFWPPTGVIAPDGSTAAVAEPGHGGSLTVHLINLRSGETHDLNVRMGSPGSDLPLGAELNNQSMVWSPDSRYLFVVAADGELVAVNARSGLAESIGVALPPVSQVAIRT